MNDILDVLLYEIFDEHPYSWCIIVLKSLLIVKEIQ